MKLVKCIEERFGSKTFRKGERYWMDENSTWEDLDGDKYATFYFSHIPSKTHKLGQYKISHFSIEHDCSTCIYSTYPKDCKKICVVVEGKERL